MVYSFQQCICVLESNIKFENYDKLSVVLVKEQCVQITFVLIAEKGYGPKSRMKCTQSRQAQYSPLLRSCNTFQRGKTSDYYTLTRHTNKRI